VPGRIRTTGQEAISMTAKPAATHIREHRSVLADIEKRTLVTIARRLPRWMNSDHLSALGLAGMALASASFVAFRWNPWAAAAGVIAALAVNWFGDSLDGTVARVRNQQRPRYGFYVDHAIDIAGSSMLFAGMAGSGLMSPLVAMTLLAAYLLVSAESYLATHAAGIFRMSFLGFGPTELRIVLAIGVLRATTSPTSTIGGVTLQLFDIGGAVAAAGLVFAFLVSSLRNTRALYLAEPIPSGLAESKVA
jgi:archaetidylinositol phosphate synthase